MRYEKSVIISQFFSNRHYIVFFIVLNKFDVFLSTRLVYEYYAASQVFSCTLSMLSFEREKEKKIFVTGPLTKINKRMLIFVADD